MIVEQNQRNTGPVVATTMKRFASHSLQVSQPSVGPSCALSSNVATTKLAQVEHQAATKITALESHVDTLAEQVAKQQQVTEGKMQGLQTGLSLVQQQVEAQSSQMDSKLTDMFQRLLNSQTEGIARIESSNRRTIEGLRQEYQTGYTELKALLDHSPKPGGLLWELRLPTPHHRSRCSGE